MMERLFVSTPVAGFRVAQAREYWETYRCPPPSTVYGMLLSLVGEPNRLVHRGAELALALLGEATPSRVLRSLWRVKSVGTGPGLGENKRPDYQELLTGLRFGVWVRAGESEEARPALTERVALALANPASVPRFGGLSLGESSHLVDEVRRWRPDDPARGWWLVADPGGEWSLPVWPDHVGSAGTRLGQYTLRPGPLDGGPSPDAWTAIMPPQAVA